MDAGGASGAQTRWFAENSACYAIMMGLLHSIIDVAQSNLVGFKNVDII